MAIEAKKSGQSYSPALAKKASMPILARYPLRAPLNTLVLAKYMTRGIKPRHRPQRPREPGAVAMGPGLLFEGLHFSFIHAADEQIHCCTTAKRGARS
jgi:hypothetical protein